jgi:molybdopterin-guanine dinucleotide biosynthesis protein A
LSALSAGGAVLRRRGHEGSTVLLAVDLPFITVDFLRYLVDFPGSGTVVPFVRGEPQPVCARYSPQALVLAADAVRRGERSIRELLRLLPEVQWVGPRMWGAVAEERVLADVDTPEDLRALGLPVEGGVEQ